MLSIHNNNDSDNTLPTVTPMLSHQYGDGEQAKQDLCIARLTCTESSVTNTRCLKPYFDPMDISPSLVATNPMYINQHSYSKFEMLDNNEISSISPILLRKRHHNKTPDSLTTTTATQWQSQSSHASCCSGDSRANTVYSDLAVMQSKGSPLDIESVTALGAESYVQLPAWSGHNNCEEQTYQDLCYVMFSSAKVRVFENCVRESVNASYNCVCLICSFNTGFVRLNT